MILYACYIIYIQQFISTKTSSPCNFLKTDENFIIDAVKFLSNPEVQSENYYIENSPKSYGKPVFAMSWMLPKLLVIIIRYIFQGQIVSYFMELKNF